MCGIAASYAFRSGAEVELDAVERTCDAMRRRGPDASGRWVSPDGRVIMGHRRLSIIDPSHAADQPMHSRDGRYTIVFNGEIYNYKELRRGDYKTQSDTEVLLELFAAEGEAMVPKLRGMFAICIWDSVGRRLFLARDAYGIKPLYYAVAGGAIRVASQVKALLAGGASHTVDSAGVAGFLLRGSIPEPFTLYEEIRAVPAGSTMVVSEFGVGLPRKFFSLAGVFRDAAEGPRFSQEEAMCEVRAALTESVRAHLVSDVPVGAFLSAGKDSTTIVALAQESHLRDILLTTLTFEGRRGMKDDESGVARDFARSRDLRHEVAVLTRGEFLREIPHMIEAMDQPTIDAFNSYFVSRAAAQRGCKVMLSGTGGDELFGGYSTFRKIPSLVRNTRALAGVPSFNRLMRRAYARLMPAGPRYSPKTASTLEYGPAYATAYLLKRGLFLPWELPRVIGEERAREGLARLQIVEQINAALDPDPGTAWSRVAALEGTFFMRDQLLRDIDWSSMAHSLEVRVPLVDPFLLRRVARYVVRGHGNQKRLLTSAPVRPLPDSVLHRPKTGFTVPVRDWLFDGQPSQFGMRDWALTLLRTMLPHEATVAAPDAETHSRALLRV
jgi:asparagine synthase (glutamine-hydrolysing)